MQIPGHSKGFEPLAWGPSPAVKFCDALPGVNQLYDDPEGVTYKTLHALMGEMAALTQTSTTKNTTRQPISHSAGASVRKERF